MTRIGIILGSTGDALRAHVLDRDSGPQGSAARIQTPVQTITGARDTAVPPVSGPFLHERPPKASTSTRTFTRRKALK